MEVHQKFERDIEMGHGSILLHLSDEQLAIAHLKIQATLMSESRGTIGIIQAFKRLIRSAACRTDSIILMTMGRTVG